MCLEGRRHHIGVLRCRSWWGWLAEFRLILELLLLLLLMELLLLLEELALILLELLLHVSYEGKHL